MIFASEKSKVNSDILFSKVIQNYLDWMNINIKLINSFKQTVQTTLFEIIKIIHTVEKKRNMDTEIIRES